MTLRCVSVLLGLATLAAAADPPHVRDGQLIVQGRPLLLRGGELGNSSAGTAAQADTILPELARLHLNFVLMPLAWDQVEPKEGAFDFTILDRWIDVARQQKLHLGLLWFGSWKNAFSEYAPDWVKSDVHRFPRVQSIHGEPLDILSTFGPETLRGETRTVAAVGAHRREKDREQQTVLMIQVENEMGTLGTDRDRSPEANRAFSAAVPPDLIRSLVDRRLDLSPELAAHFDPRGSTWREVFGDAADEVFMAWRYALHVESIARAGKSAYSLPMYVNAQLPVPMERPGDYPSGGPHPYYLAVYRAVAPSIDFYSPDIYWPDFEYWLKRYELPGNPIFIPEARADVAPWNALYAFGVGKALGFCPFAIDSLHATAESEPAIAQVYAAISDLNDMLVEAQQAGRTSGIVLHATSPRPTRTVALGGYLFEASLSRDWRTGKLQQDDGGLLLIESRPDEFFIVGAGLSVKVSRDPDTDDRYAGIAGFEQLTKSGAEWVVAARLNGDQSDQGRRLLLDAHDIRIYRVRLYSTPR